MWDVHCRESYGKDDYKKRKRKVVDGGIAERETRLTARLGSLSAIPPSTTFLFLFL